MDQNYEKKSSRSVKRRTNNQEVLGIRVSCFIITKKIQTVLIITNSFVLVLLVTIGRILIATGNIYQKISLLLWASKIEDEKSQVLYRLGFEPATNSPQFQRPTPMR